MANRKNTFLMKRSNVAGKVPASGSILLGEMALNTADVILYASGTTADSILPIGWDRIHRTGDTMNGNFIINGDLTVTGTTNFNTLTASSITNVDYIDFNINATPIHSEGRIHWDDDDKTLNIDTEQTDVSIQVGQENVMRVFNNTGVQIDDGKAVYVNGAQGNRPTIALADWSGETTSDGTIGLVTHDIPNNTNGYVTTFGLVRGYDTTSFTAGDILYLSSAGNLTNVEPQTPNHLIKVGVAINSTLSGAVFVDVVLGYELAELHDVQSTGVTNGDILQYNTSNTTWEYTSNPTFNSISATTISATTFYGDGSNLSNLSNVGLKTKSGIENASGFTGNPKIKVITFTTPFSNNNYSVVITGEDNRNWTVQSKSSTGFTINSNSNPLFTGNAFWQAIEVGESN